MDLVEVKVAKRDPQDFFSTREVLGVTPVDYKAGAPRPGEDANELWPADKMQLGLQILILRDNGYVCDDGIIYYRATKQRALLTMTPEIETWIIERIAAARAGSLRSDACRHHWSTRPSVRVARWLLFVCRMKHVF